LEQLSTIADYGAAVVVGGGFGGAMLKALIYVEDDLDADLFPELAESFGPVYRAWPF